MVDITNTIHHLRFCGEMRIGRDNAKVYFEPSNKSTVFDITEQFSEEYFMPQIQIFS